MSFMFLDEAATRVSSTPVMSLEEALMDLIGAQQDINTLNEALVQAEFSIINTVRSLNEEAEEKAAAGDEAGAATDKKAADDKKQGFFRNAGKKISQLAISVYNKVKSVFEAAINKVKSFYQTLRVKYSKVKVSKTWFSLLSSMLKSLQAMANAAAADPSKEGYEAAIDKAKADFDKFYATNGKDTSAHPDVLVKVGDVMKAAAAATSIAAAQNKILPALKTLQSRAEKDSDASKALHKQIQAATTVAAAAAKAAAFATNIKPVADSAAAKPDAKEETKEETK